MQSADSAKRIWEKKVTILEREDVVGLWYMYHIAVMSLPIL